MLTIDGSTGEGGGQILRTSLALSAITGRPFRMTDVRARRERPGLMRQHLTAVMSAAEISGAEVRGAEVGSTEIAFVPGAVRPGAYRFAIGTAGSTMLVLQTVLPPLLTAGGPSTLTLEGGTHNRQAPPFEFVERVFLPLINRMGPRVAARLERHGFYPAGGGCVVVEITPAARLEPIHLVERGAIVERRAVALLSSLAGHIAERELQVVADRLGWPPEQLHIRGVRNAVGPGNAVLLEIGSEHITELFSAIGEVGKSAERVAEEAVAQARDYLRAGAPVGPHLADQILLPLALARGGSFTTAALTRHAATNIETIGRFLDVPIRIEPAGDERSVVRIGG